MRSAGYIPKRPAASLASHSRRAGDFARRRVALFERRLLFKPDRPRAIDRCIDYFGAPAPAGARW
jgi:hypothetical protein